MQIKLEIKDGILSLKTVKVARVNFEFLSELRNVGQQTKTTSHRLAGACAF